MARNILSATPPHAVEQALKRLGDNLRTARIRRNLTIEEVADRIGAGPRAITAAESGKGSTGVVVFAALLWAYGLLEPLVELGDPARDEHGQALALAREPSRARGATGASGPTGATVKLDNDF